MTIGVDYEYIPQDALPGATLPAQRPDVMGSYCEIMQTGACLLDASGKEVQVLNKIVKAHKISEVPVWLSNLTGITAERRADEGVHFLEALDELVSMVGDKRPWTFSGDWCVLAGNCAAHGVPMPFWQPFLRVKPRLKLWGVTLADYQRHGFTEMNSGNLHTVLGIKLPSIIGVGAHDAAHDARSLTHSVHSLPRFA